MQARHPNSGAAEASTAKRTRPTMASTGLNLSCICDICGKARSTRKHQACSRKRQQLKNAEWESLQANLAAAKQQKAAKGRRHV
jgi:hypothetical protein